MGGSKIVTLAKRVDDFKSEGMVIFDKKFMMCNYCQTRVDWTRKSVVDNHCLSSSHKEKREKAKNLKRQASISDSFDKAKKVKDDKHEFILSTVRAFMKANIALHKLDDPSLRQWMCKYVSGSGDLPNAQYLRDKCVPLLKRDYDDAMKAKLKGRKIAILCDETTNKKGEAVFLTLFKLLPCEEDPHPSVFVASVKILDNVNTDQCSKCILQTLYQMDVDHQNVKWLQIVQLT